MKYFTMVLLLIFCSCTQRQSTHQPGTADTAVAKNDHEPFTNTAMVPDTIGALPKGLAAFIPAGYLPLDTTAGDLNTDAYPDMILVLKKEGEDTIREMSYDKPERRPLLILTGQADGNYKLAARNDNVVLCYNCSGMFGDAFTGITIKQGYFSVEHSIAGGQHWESVTTFKYNKEKSNWFLYKEGYISYRMNDDTSADADALVKDVETQKTAKDFGVVTFEQYDQYKE